MALTTPISFLILIMLALLVVAILILFNVWVGQQASIEAQRQSIENGKKLDKDIKENELNDERMANQTIILLTKINNDHVGVQTQHEDIKQNATREIKEGLNLHFNLSEERHNELIEIHKELLEEWKNHTR